MRPTMTDVSNPNKLVLEAMSPDEAVEIFKAWLRNDGSLLAWAGTNLGWAPVHIGGILCSESVYRVVSPPPKALDLGGVWPVLQDWVQWVAMDDDGDIWGYAYPPVLQQVMGLWGAAGNDDLAGSLYGLKVDTDGVDWRTSLQSRPEGM